MSFFSSLQVTASGLRAERLRVDLASSNLANANATRSADGGPYRRRDPVLRAQSVNGPFGDRLSRALKRVDVRGVQIDQRAPREVFDPSHPDSDENGVVLMPRVNVVEEMVNLMNAQRSFEANLAAFSASRQMAQRVLRIGRTG